MRDHIRRVLVFVSAVLTAAVTAGLFDAAPAASARTAGSPAWAIRGARVVTPGRPVIDKATVVMRNGLIESVGADVAVPVDAVVIDGAGLSVYPGLIDMANSAEAPDANAAATAAGRTGGGRGEATTATLVDMERARRAALLRPDAEAARTAVVPTAEMRRLTAAGITSVLAVPGAGLLRGQSALINVAAPPDAPHISNIGDYRQGLAVVRAPVASHIAFGAGRGGGYPASLLGYIAFVRQSLHDAQWQRNARAYSERHPSQPRPVFEPVLDALAPVLEGKLPAAFDANTSVEIQRSLSMAREFKLTPIIVGGREAAALAADLKAANARVIYSLNFPAEPGRGGRGAQGRAGGAPPAEETVRARGVRLNAPKVPAALLAAGVPFAFGSSGLQNAADFLRNAGRTVSEGGLSADEALRALTLGAATMSGAGERLGTIAAGRIANVIVTDGDLFATATRIRHVFVDGYPIEIQETPAADTGRGRGQPPPQD